MEAKGREKGWFLRFYGNQASICYESVEFEKRRKDVEKQLAEARKRTYQGVLSTVGQRTIQKRIYSWIEAVRAGNEAHNLRTAKEQVRLIFITLTLSGSQKNDDRWIKKNMLELFIKRLQYNYGVKHYFWKAEAQANGNLHFHIVADKFIPKDEIKFHWNSIQKENGYLIEYQKKFNRLDPPSTHVRELTLMPDAVGYVMKYCKKGEDRRPIQGAIFRFSKSLVELVIPSIHLTPQYFKEWEEFSKEFSKKVISEDYHKAYILNTKKKKFEVPKFVREETNLYYNEAFNLLYDWATKFGSLGSLAFAVNRCSPRVRESTPYVQCSTSVTSPPSRKAVFLTPSAQVARQGRTAQLGIFEGSPPLTVFARL